MIPPVTARSNAVPQNYPLSANLSIFWIPPKVVKEQTTEFTSTLLHEIRNPLTTINLAIEAMRVMIPDGTNDAYLDIIKRGAGKINELVTDLLINSEVHNTRPEENSVEQLLDEVLIMANDRLLLKNITVCKLYDKQDCKVVLSRQKMKIALTNIIINAIDAMASENGQLKLTTRFEDGKYIAEIEDNGIGISKEHLGVIFEPYFTSKPTGMGLGLSTTLDILLSNNVKVDVRSREGEGTQFLLFFDC